MRSPFAKTSPPATPPPDADAPMTTARIRVDQGYQPDAVVSTLGDLVRITFHREDDSPCSERVVFADLGVDAFLPRHEDVTVEVRPEHAGEYAFTCEMGMLRGRLTVVPAREERT